MGYVLAFSAGALAGSLLMLLECFRYGSDVRKKLALSIQRRL